MSISFQCIEILSLFFLSGILTLGVRTLTPACINIHMCMLIYIDIGTLNTIVTLT